MEEKDFHGRVQSVDRAMMLLEVLGEDEEGNRLSDLASRTGLAPSTVHRLLTTLEQRQFIRFDPAGRLWHIGRQAFAVGSVFARQRNIAAAALPFLRRLRDQSRETANLGIADQGEMLVVSQIQSREIARAVTHIGGKAPMAASAMGKAILATYSDEDVTAILARHGLRRLTANTLTRRADLDGELQTIRQNGYAVDNEECQSGLRCISAAVYDHQGEALCAISVSGLATRISEDRITVLGSLLAEAAGRLTIALSGTFPRHIAAG
ncbi:IclR family transcriptional regulator [Rhizobium bangladeshense]|uniref:IclR family transcriptional regulator n=1 Tax=Rhizobium bangladeshense TaxID=1138189 RepID=UPI000A8B7C37|nr:IclR family transcriptional regulator [Rhizobium bangladeshense]